MSAVFEKPRGAARRPMAVYGAPLADLQGLLEAARDLVAAEQALPRPSPLAPEVRALSAALLRLREG